MSDDASGTETVQAKAQAIDMLKNTKIFSVMSDEALARLYSGCTLEIREPGEDIVCQGDAADFFFIIRSGQCDVLITTPDPTADEPTRTSTRCVVTLTKGSLIGDIALLREGAKRNATVRVSGEVAAELLVLDKPGFYSHIDDASLKLIRENAAYKDACTKEPSQRTDADVKILMERTRVLTDRFTYEAHLKLCSLMRYRQLAAGDIICTAGKPADSLHILLSGTVSVTEDPQKDSSQSAHLRRYSLAQTEKLKAGDCIGMNELLKKQPSHGASAACDGSVELFDIRRADCEHIMNEVARIAHLLECLAIEPDDRSHQQLDKICLGIAEAAPDFVRNLTSEQHTEMARHATARVCVPGEQIVAADLPPMYFYIVLGGAVSFEEVAANIPQQAISPRRPSVLMVPSPRRPSQDIRGPPFSPAESPNNSFVGRRGSTFDSPIARRMSTFAPDSLAANTSHGRRGRRPGMSAAKTTVSLPVGEQFHHVPLVLNKPSYGYTAYGDSQRGASLLLLPKAVYDSTLRASVEASMSKTVKLLMDSQSFGLMSEEALISLYFCLKPKLALAGEDVVTQGDDADFCFIIRSGKCDVLIADPKKPNEGARKVVSLAAGALVGEIALLKKGTKR